MRPLSAISAAFLIASVFAMPGWAETPPPAAGTAARPPAPGCVCPGVRQGRAARVQRHARHHAWHRRHWRPAHHAAAVPLRYPPVYYDPPIPSPYDSAYDRGMTLHYRSPTVSGAYRHEPGFPPTPPIRGVQHYRLQAGEAVFQYDGLTGEYIRLAQSDARRVLAVSGPPR